MSARILLVEDDPALLSILQAAIGYGGFTADAVGTGAEALEMFDARPFDVILIDLGLPDRDGAEVLKAMREKSDVPILVVSGRASEADKIAALDQGADDYVAKPFLPGELLARIRAAMRRHRSHRDRPELDRGRAEAVSMRDPIHIGPLTLDPFDRSVEMAGRKTVLSDAEFKILSRLATNRDGVVSKGTLLKTLYDSDALDETRIVEVYISNIRRKLRGLHEGECILNFRGRGWKLVVPGS
ncbi:MAG: response regulator transcription factor [Sphingosinicella sp.]